MSCCAWDSLYFPDEFSLNLSPQKIENFCKCLQNHDQKLCERDLLSCRCVVIPGENNFRNFSF